ncbi:MAG: trypsin-like peptidase domain-containing protein [Alphaproteobacteria bacterium]
MNGLFRSVGPAALTLLIGLFFLSTPAAAQTDMERAIASVVSVLPKWPGYEQGGAPQVPAGTAPEGTAVVWRAEGYLATALHVVEQAESIRIRLYDGRVFKADLVAGDRATDLALLKARLPDGVSLPPVQTAEPPGLGEDVCAIGNAFGLDLSVTCGVVSARSVSDAGFNAIEDFVQTDAAMNPGMSGGGLFDRQSNLVGLLLAIVTKQSDANVGVNFAVSSDLLSRVIDDLLNEGRVRRTAMGIGFGDLPLESRETVAGALVSRVREGSPADNAGLEAGDIVTQIGTRKVKTRADAMTASYLLLPDEETLLVFWRGDKETRTTIIPATVTR